MNTESDRQTDAQREKESEAQREREKERVRGGCYQCTKIFWMDNYK